MIEQRWKGSRYFVHLQIQSHIDNKQCFLYLFCKAAVQMRIVKFTLFKNIFYVDNFWNVYMVESLCCMYMCRCITDPAYEDVNNAFERALVFLHKVSAVCTLLNHYRGENFLQDSLCTARKRTHLVQDFCNPLAIHCTKNSCKKLTFPCT